jgi:exosortase
MPKKIIHLERTQIALCIKALVIILVTILLFHPDLAILFNDALQSEAASYILAVPFLFAFFVYRKRKMLRAVIPLENKNQPKEVRYLPLIAGILLFVIAVVLYWYGSYTFTPLEYHLLALPIFTAGLTIIFFNVQTLRQLIFPIVFLAFLMPPPSEILYYLGTTLSVVSAEAPNALLQAIGVASTITGEYGNPTIILTRPDNTTMEFTIDLACSGIYSLLGFLIFALFIAYTIRDKPWKKLALIIIGIPLVYALNILRIIIILLIGYYYGETLALQMFHLLGGWALIFIGTLLLLLISEKIFKTQIFTGAKEKCPRCNPNSYSEDFCFSCSRILKPQNVKLGKGDIAKIGSIAITLILLISIQAPVFAIAQLQPTIIVTTPSGEQNSTQILPQISGYNLRFLYRDIGFEAIAKQDMSLAYLYSPNNQTKEPVWATIEIASARSSLHRWETCLITWPLSQGYQPRVAQIELKDIKLNENPPIISRYFAFTYTATNQTQVVLYWYETAVFAINSTLQQKHMKISLIAYPDDVESLPQIENQLVTLATEISNYWQPAKTWSQITLIISQNGVTLALASSAILMATAILYTFENRRQKRANANAYQKLSKLNKQIVDIIRETEKNDTPTFRKIAEACKKTTKNLNEEELLQKLIELERTGIIKSQIVNKQDEPIQTWRTQI